MRKKLAARALVLTVIGTAGVSVALAGPAATVKAASNAKLGSIVVSGGGLTLYHLTGEKHGSIKCGGGCTAFWPPLLVTGKPHAGPGIDQSKLGTVKRPGGKFQVTYNGLALYRYADDHKPGQANGQGLPGQGVPGTWYAVSTAGKAVTSSRETATAPTTTSNSTTTSSGYGKGY